MGGGARARRSDARGRAMRAGRSDACATEHARGASAGAERCVRGSQRVGGVSAGSQLGGERCVRGVRRGEPARGRSAACAGCAAEERGVARARCPCPLLACKRPLLASSLFAWSLVLRMACLLAATEVCLVFYRWNLIKVI